RCRVSRPRSDRGGQRAGQRHPGAGRVHDRGQGRKQARAGRGVRVQVLPMSTINLTGKVAVVTGAGQGLGRAYAVALARAGASVVVNDLDVQAAQETAALAGERATAVGGDVGDRATATALVNRAVEAFGRLDAMVTNAGVLRDA